MIAGEGPAGQTWRLPVRWRVALLLLQALIPAAAAATFWIPLDGRQYPAKPACGLLLAAATAAWLGLAARAWRKSVTWPRPCSSCATRSASTGYPSPT